MDKYEYRVKTEQLLEYTEKKQYRKAMEIADTIDWRRVKSASMLNTVSEVYEYCGEFQKSRDILFMAFDRSPGSRKIVYRLATLALKVNDPDEASDCYEEFVKLAPKDPNQYILKYRILKVQRAPVEEQIAALEEFKKAEYIEKWAYELAKLYHDAGMVRECLEECDDLILWFSEGKYVYLAMELKMKYKPLTPLQQEKYDKHTGKKTKDIVIPGQEEEDEEEDKTETANGNTQEIPPLKEEAATEKEEVEEKSVPKQTPTEEKDDVKEAEEEKSKPRAPITRIVTGATLEEALASGVAMAAGLNQEEKAMAERDEELKVSGQMKIEDILQEWEEKQKVNADAIEKQKAEDKERLRIERQEAEKRKEASRKAAEEAARKAEEEARKKAAEEAARKAEEEAKKKAEEAAARKEAEETARKAEEAAKKAEEARRKAAEEAEKLAASQTAAKKKAKGAATSAPKSKKTKKNILEEKTQKLPDDIMELVEQLESRVSGTASPQKEEEEEFEQEDLLEALAEDFGEGEPAVLLEAELQVDESEEEYDFKEEEPEEDLLEEEESEGDFEEDDFEEEEPEGEDVGEEEPENDESEDDFEEEESEDDFGDDESEEGFEEDDFEDDESEDFEKDDFEDESEEEDFEDDESEEDFEEDNFDDESEEDFEEDDFDDDESEEDFEEDDFDDDESEEDFEEDDFDDESEEDFEEDFEEDDFDDESEEDFEEDDFDDESDEDFEEDEFGEEGDFDEDEFDEDEFIESEDDFDEEDFDEDDFEEEDFEDGESEDEDDFDEDELDEDELDEDELDEEDFEEEEEEEISLEIEEPSEEEIQKRFKKAKGGGGVPFDTGFVVTGRYDLSATSEIGLKAGLTEEQKKLFSYFVPVRGMSEQIVEALDNDRRAQREGTSKTGNLLVIGRKGSGKTVLAVDIVKAIQKQRNLKQGKVAIVTGESLNKKELPNIIQKLKGGAIIVEKAGKLNSRTVKELNHLMERKTGEMLFVLEDQRKPLEKVLTANPEFKKKFTSKLELPIFINDELVTFGQTYAKENGYKLDEMGILALYSRIDVMQREDHAVSVAEVKEIMDEAISHSQRVNVKHLARRVFGKGTDDSDRIILKEEDFKI
ncbi:hypothetical protein C818_02047 [Lachnospiraceae bacterium MD308]|nr:hypothetical protein C818_02047 [Lachnospiraceae bacterium MD308]